LESTFAISHLKKSETYEYDDSTERIRGHFSTEDAGQSIIQFS